jgi:hypothetical protein
MELRRRGFLLHEASVEDDAVSKHNMYRPATMIPEVHFLNMSRDEIHKHGLVFDIKQFESDKERLTSAVLEYVREHGHPAYSREAAQFIVDVHYIEDTTTQHGKQCLVCICAFGLGIKV